MSHGPARSIAWRWASLVVGGLGFACEPNLTSVGAYIPGTEDGLYIEAEDGLLSGGFTIVDDSSASAARFIKPPPGITSDDVPGLAQARYSLALTSPGTYAFWGRIRSPSASHNRFWFRLDGGAWIKWRISVGDIWYWDDFHDDADYGTALTFELSEGVHELILANCAEGAALDRLYVTSSGNEPEGNQSPCSPPHSIEIAGSCLPSCGALAGNVCGVAACSGLPVLPAYDCDVCCHLP